jgi:hypothetical protein
MIIMPAVFIEKLLPLSNAQLNHARASIHKKSMPIADQASKLFQLREIFRRIKPVDEPIIARNSLMIRELTQEIDALEASYKDFWCKYEGVELALDIVLTAKRVLALAGVPKCMEQKHLRDIMPKLIALGNPDVFWQMEAVLSKITDAQDRETAYVAMLDGIRAAKTGAVFFNFLSSLLDSYKLVHPDEYPEAQVSPAPHKPAVTIEHPPATHIPTSATNPPMPLSISYKIGELRLEPHHVAANLKRIADSFEQPEGGMAARSHSNLCDRSQRVLPMQFTELSRFDKIEVKPDGKIWVMQDGRGGYRNDLPSLIAHFVEKTYHLAAWAKILTPQLRAENVGAQRAYKHASDPQADEHNLRFYTGGFVSAIIDEMLVSDKFARKIMLEAGIESRLVHFVLHLRETKRAITDLQSGGNHGLQA